MTALPSAAPAETRLIPSIDEVRRLLTAPGAPFETESATIRGVATRVWKNIPRNLRDVLATAGGHGEREMIVYGDERASYAAFHQAVANLAADLVAAGLAKGDRVALVMRNLPEWPVAYFACVAVGGIIAPLNAWGTADEIAYGLADCGARFAIIDEERLERLRPVLPGLAGLERIYVARPERPLDEARAVSLDAVIGRPAAWATHADARLPEVDIDPEDVATIYYTSGTTGRPKGAYATHRATLSNLAAIPFAAARAALRRGAEPPAPNPNGPQRAALIGLPLFHVTGCNVILITNINAGNKLVIMYKWDVERAFELIERERVTNTGGVPALAWQMLEHPRRGDYDLSSIERMNWGGAPASPELERGMRAAFPHATISTGWGMTEVSGVHTDIAETDLAARPDSCGTPVGDYEIKVCDQDGNELPRGAVGELWAAGPNICIGYWEKPEATAETFVDGWVRTGDLAMIDEDGFCYIVDRAKDMLIRGGENIYCIEVENALYQHPAVLDAAVVGIPHRVLGEEPGAVVTVRPGQSVIEEELRAFLREHIAAYKVPVRIVFSHEPLPRNPSGKILKPACKQMMAI